MNDNDNLLSINGLIAELAKEFPKKTPSRQTINLAITRGEIGGAKKNEFGFWQVPLEAARAWNERRPGHGGRPRKKVATY